MDIVNYVFAVFATILFSSGWVLLLLAYLSVIIAVVVVIIKDVRNKLRQSRE